MKRYLIFVAASAITLLGFLGCKGDNSTTSQLQPSLQSQNNGTNPEQQDLADNQTADESVGPTGDGSRSGICFANNFIGERFRVISYADYIIEASIDPIDCKLQNDRLKGEVRRPGVKGIREFVGDARAIHGNRIKIYTGKLPKLCRPKKGELLTMIWKARRRR